MTHTDWADRYLAKKRSKMKTSIGSRYLNRSEGMRCKAVVALKDGSEANCQRYRIANGSSWCAQHTKIELARSYTDTPANGYDDPKCAR